MIAANPSLDSSLWLRLDTTHSEVRRRTHGKVHLIGIGGFGHVSPEPAAKRDFIGSRDCPNRAARRHPYPANGGRPITCKTGERRQGAGGFGPARMADQHSAQVARTTVAASVSFLN